MLHRCLRAKRPDNNYVQTGPAICDHHHGPYQGQAVTMRLMFMASVVTFGWRWSPGRYAIFRGFCLPRQTSQIDGWSRDFQQLRRTSRFEVRWSAQKDDQWRYSCARARTAVQGQREV